MPWKPPAKTISNVRLDTKNKNKEMCLKKGTELIAGENLKSYETVRTVVIFYLFSTASNVKVLKF